MFCHTPSPEGEHPFGSIPEPVEELSGLKPHDPSAPPPWRALSHTSSTRLNCSWSSLGMTCTRHSRESICGVDRAFGAVEGLMFCPGHTKFKTGCIFRVEEIRDLSLTGSNEARWVFFVPRKLFLRNEFCKKLLQRPPLGACFSVFAISTCDNV